MVLAAQNVSVQGIHDTLANGVTDMKGMTSGGERKK